jgi:FkbM family methyltransferase
VTCELFTGQRMRVVRREIVGAELCRTGFIEAPVTRFLLRHLRPGMVFVDVGAHYGYHSLVASLVVGHGRVVSLEPGRGVFPLLAANVAGAGNVDALPVAAFSGEATLHLRDFGPHYSALSTLLPSARVPPAERRGLRGGTYPVRAVALDDLLDAAGLVPDVVKLDAEGAELAILGGMRRLLEQVGPVVTLETGDYDGMASPATAECLDLLAAHGYRAYEPDAVGDLRPHRRRPHYDYGNLFLLKG